MFFRRNRNIEQKPPIVVADQMLMNAMTIAYGYLHNKRYMPTEADLKMFCEFVEELHTSHATANYIATCLYQRSQGKPEGAQKFTDPDSFDYHFPK